MNLNTDLITRTLKRIEAEPKKFNMTWFYNRLTQRLQKMEPAWSHMACGTICCFAGEAVLEGLGPKALQLAFKDTRVVQVAQGLLGFTDEDAEALFYPLNYGLLSRDLPGTKAYAKFYTTAIRKYIEEKYGVAV